jgi:hypothetical protein
MESCAHRLKQNMRDQFRIQLMKLPLQIRRMPVSEFCEVYHADVNAVVSAEIIKSKNPSMNAPEQAQASARKTPARAMAREAVKPLGAAVAPNAFPSLVSIDALKGLHADEQARYLEALRAQLNALQSQLQITSTK